MYSQDKTETILDLTEMLENELRTTYEGIEEGRPYKDYMIRSLNAYYQFIEWYNAEGLIHYDLEGIKKRDKERFNKVFEDEEGEEEDL